MNNNSFFSLMLFFFFQAELADTLLLMALDFLVICCFVYILRHNKLSQNLSSSQQQFYLFAIIYSLGRAQQRQFTSLSWGIYPYPKDKGSSLWWPGTWVGFSWPDGFRVVKCLILKIPPYNKGEISRSKCLGLKTGIAWFFPWFNY